MIEITDLHGQSRYVNAEMIEMIESNPDTLIVLGNGHRYYVKESARTVAERVIAYHRECFTPRDLPLTQPPAVREPAEKDQP
jgi:flagellar protein FlbD